MDKIADHRYIKRESLPGICDVPWESGPTDAGNYEVRTVTGIVVQHLPLPESAHIKVTEHNSALATRRAAGEGAGDA